jgi:hypothetical protein
MGLGGLGGVHCVLTPRSGNDENSAGKEWGCLLCFDMTDPFCQRGLASAVGRDGIGPRR